MYSEGRGTSARSRSLGRGTKYFFDPTMQRIEKIVKIYLYDDGISRASADVDALRDYCESLAGATVILRASPVDEVLRGMKLDRREEALLRGARVFARYRVRNTEKQGAFPDPLKAELRYEKARLGGGNSSGVSYEGHEVQLYFASLIPRRELGWRHIHIILTDQLILTRDPDDLRYHARVVLLGYPSIISSRGLIEGPARPRGYYIESGVRASFGPPSLATEAAKANLGKRFLDHGDERTTEVLKGPLSQAIFYYIFGEVFCQDKGCRLFNARWQEDMLFAQLGSGYKFCPRHAAMLKNNPLIRKIRG